MNKALEIITHEVKESLTMALVALRTNKLRSILTLLGVAVGVFSIIGVMTAMQALVSGIETGMSQLGVNTFQVQKYPAFGSGNPRDRAKLRNRKNLTLKDGLTVKENSRFAKAVGLESWQGGKIVKSVSGEKTNPNVALVGEDIDGFTTNNWAISDGRLYTQEELNAHRRVAVLAAGVSKKLFPRIYPIGQAIRVDNEEYEVIGLIEQRGDMLGGSNDNFLAIPLTTYFEEYGKERSIHIMVQSTGADTYDDCLEQVRGILRTSRNVPPGEEDDFEIFSNDSLITQFNDFTKYVRLGILLISAIALIAAGVGIMNIMMVSVTERTREIGIRKAIGARKSNILGQFIMEAVVLSEIGGAIGIGFGILAGNLIGMMLSAPVVVPLDWVAIGFISCSVVGITFGVYPAWKASNLDPIESLRYE